MKVANADLDNDCQNTVPMHFRTLCAASLLQLALLLGLPVSAQAQFSWFSIGTNGVVMNYVFDGSNFLVGVENHLTIPTTIGARMISPNGSKVGSLIPTGRSGIATAVAFDGTNYLLIWEDDGLGTLEGNTGWQIYGQFISDAEWTSYPGRFHRLRVP